MALINHHSPVSAGQRWAWVIGAIQRKEEVYEVFLRWRGGNRRCKGGVVWWHVIRQWNGLTYLRGTLYTCYNAIGHTVADDAVEVKEGNMCVCLAQEQIILVSLQLWIMCITFITVVIWKTGGIHWENYPFVIFSYPFVRIWFSCISHIMSVCCCIPGHVCHWCNTKARGSWRTLQRTGRLSYKS